MTAVLVYLCLSAGATLGFLLCGILTAGKTADQDAEIWSLRSRLYRLGRYTEED